MFSMVISVVISVISVDFGDFGESCYVSYVSYVFDVIPGPETSVDAFRYSGLILVLSPEE